MTVAYLLPEYPVARTKKGAGKCTNAEIVEISGAEVGLFGEKQGIGKMGVHLRCHKASEFKQLSEEQKEELFQWRKSKSKDKENRTIKKKVKVNEEVVDVSTVISKQLDEKLTEMIKKKKEKRQTDEDTISYIMSLFNDPEEV